MSNINCMERKTEETIRIKMTMGGVGWQKVGEAIRGININGKNTIK